VPGFPIRKSSNHSPVAGSSRLIAGSNVLHRLLVPRHPPYALKNLATFAHVPINRYARRLDARVHCAVLKIRTEQGPSRRIRVTPTQAVRVSALSEAAASSGPNSVLGIPSPARLLVPQLLRGGERTNRRAVRRDCRITSAPLESMDAQPHVRWLEAPVLLRKEVIQPHLPVRLPCYDFVPIADPTFDSSLPYGLGRRLRVLPTFVT
jgi:hypothetical protein